MNRCKSDNQLGKKQENWNRLARGGVSETQAIQSSLTSEVHKIAFKAGNSIGCKTGELLEGQIPIPP